MEPLAVLRLASFGNRTAEDEREHLKRYFVETEQWARVFGGEIDIVYGPKGSGKSAIYSLILENKDDLLRRGILTAAAENPQGAPAFQTLASEPPSGEFDFIALWKMYFLAIAARELKVANIENESANRVVREAEEANLIPADWTLAKALRYAMAYVTDLPRRLSAIESTIEIDHNSGLPKGFGGKISFQEPSPVHARLGVIAIDDLLSKASEAFRGENLSLWILLDRLDVAFADKSDLEADVLRALFRTYRDMASLNGIRLKIFLRSDIWDQITRGGFREASHLERALTITWTDDDILNLLVRRLLSNDSIRSAYNADSANILSNFDGQTEFFYKIFPKQVDSGPNKPSSFKWILTRTKDAGSATAPREVIHFLNELRATQISRLERGVPVPADSRLFEPISFKEALPAVSRVRLEQTLYAEYPQLKPFIEALRQQKAQQNIASLTRVWGVSAEKVQSISK